MSAAPAAADAATRTKRGLARKILAGVLVVLTSLSIVVASVTTWAHQTIFKTERWIAVTGPLPKNPAVADAMSRFTMQQIGNMVDLQAAVEQALPSELAPLADVVLDRVRARIQARLTTFIESDTFNQIWVAVNTRVHDAIVRILRGESNRLEVEANGQVRLNLVPLVYAGLTFLQEHASFALRGHTVPVGVDPVTEPEAAVQALATEFGRPLQPDFAQPVVFTSQSLVAAQDAVHLFDVAFWVALLLPLVLIVATIWLSKAKRRRALQLAAGAFIAVLLGQTVIRRIEASVADGVAPGNRGAVRDVLRATVHDLQVLLVVCIVVSLVVVVVAYLMGRPAWFMRFLAWCRRMLTSERATKAERYAGAHATELMWGGVAVAVIVWWIVGLSWVSFGIVGGLLVGWLVLTEYLRRRFATPAGDDAAGAETAGHPA
jgi:hypothetical protein